MKRAALKKKTSSNVDWATEVRKYKPQLNALTDAQRQELLEEGLRLIYGSNAKKIVRSH